MTAYLIVVGILFLLSIFERGEPNKLGTGKIACAILVIFGGLRHETGFDWVEYEYYYELIQPIWATRTEFATSNLLIEPGFQFFCFILKSLGFSFQMFLFTITCFNMVVIYFFAKRYTSRIALVFLIYFGFVFLAGQMAAIRQTFSYSFVLLAFLQRDRGKFFWSLILIFVAVSIHSFSIVFAPLLYIRPKLFPVPMVAAVVALGVLAAYSGFHIVPLAADYFLPRLGAGFLATKLSLYGDYEGYTISLVSLSFIPLHLIAYFLLTTRRYKLAVPLDNLTYFTISVTLLSLICHSYFGVFPAFWNRVSYLTFLLQAVALTARYQVYFSSLVVRQTSNSLAAAAGMAIIGYTLNQPTSLPFTPYQNAAVAWATGDQGDGRLRYQYAFGQAEMEIAKRRR